MSEVRTTVHKRCQRRRTTLALVGRLSVLVSALAVTALLAACGSGSTGEATRLAAPGRATDREFIALMVPHHEGAIEMARAALKRAEHPEIRRLARAIVATQKREVATLRAIHRDLFGGKPGPPRAHRFGMTMDEAGMHHDMPMLERARPFDRAFIDMMIPHHEGAVRMARVELGRGSDPRLKRIARAIVKTQSAEIKQLRTWRDRWYGASESGGGSSGAAHPMMGH
ncbi:DUF305 domain-containing protein [Thermoleophilum album]|uniref:DUF305 domain-containing protein n=1 Tax=Thermoleophilum album TaxID=29539 RepID=UPI00237CAA78|nr:DUF305 domain-containing protein [Thermoleophilum album]WDT93526.1 DUF305 domain-containing protein [Thermoleophilum album]